MINRNKTIAAFLSENGWSAWQRKPLTGDASDRRYERLIKGDQSAILMDAPPETTEPFANIATLLTDHGLNPPEIHAHDPMQGLMIISDLGTFDFAHWLSDNPHESKKLYRAAADILLHIAQITPPDTLIRMTPDVGAKMVEITGEYYGTGTCIDVVTEVKSAMAQYASNADTLSLRDFHAENLIWRESMTGTARVGLLDFQDAFVAPAGYDLTSMIRDVRRDIAPDIIADMMDYYMHLTNAPADFRAQLACLGAQRNLRILGVFARLSLEMGKPRYVDLIPRVWANLMQDLRHPVLSDLRQAVLDTLPEPDPQTLKRLRA